MACNCMFGTCINAEEGICECDPGYVGKDCEEIYLGFSTKGLSQHSTVIVVVVVCACVFLALFTFACFSYRRWRSIRKRHAMSKNLLRRQSRVTIEGYSVPGYTPELPPVYETPKPSGPVVAIHEESEVGDFLSNREDMNVNVNFSMRTEI
ncbi:uncharacterized protein LOC143473187 [Clavelina lepadiformis]|uniref:uncharacterized protein LOC143473187 n=1 Tax=Clavelina lepadiformis TaxID=159417 RepID=UPI004043259D